MDANSGNVRRNLTMRDQNLIKYGEVNGAIEMFRRALQESGRGSFEGLDLLTMYIDFITNKTYMERVPRHILDYFKKRFDGGNVRFYCGQGVVMALYRRKIRAVFPESRLKPPTPKVVQSPQTFTSKGGADIPLKGGSIFDAALQNQLPSRGRSVPNGHLHKAPGR